MTRVLSHGTLKIRHRPLAREGPAPERLLRVIEQMREELNETRRQVQELREALKRLSPERGENK